MHFKLSSANGRDRRVSIDADIHGHLHGVRRGAVIAPGRSYLPIELDDEQLENVLRQPGVKLEGMDEEASEALADCLEQLGKPGVLVMKPIAHPRFKAHASGVDERDVPDTFVDDEHMIPDLATFVRHGYTEKSYEQFIAVARKAKAMKLAGATNDEIREKLDHATAVAETTSDIASPVGDVPPPTE